MFRNRLASLALACGLLFTISGCCAFCEDGRMFPRLFRSTGYRPGLLTGRGHECECPAPDGTHGPILTTPHFPPSPVPITTNPPLIQKVPQAQSTPYHPNPG